MIAKGHENYEPLTLDTLSRRLGTLEVLTSQIGADPKSWRSTEIGDGNLNLVFVVEGPLGSAIVKQALPYVRMIGDSWPLPLSRAYFEYQALIRQAQWDPGSVPHILHFDQGQAIIVMERLHPHRILRQMLIGGLRVEGLGDRLGRFCARTAFRGSELSMTSADKKANVALFSGSVEIPAITESLVFTDPYYAAARNHHTTGMDGLVARLRADAYLKQRVQDMLMRFSASTETLLHGDLHTGSIMATTSDVRVIDPEFAQYGPMGFDMGMLVANFLMAYFSQPAHRSESTLADYQEWLLDVISTIFNAFDNEFRTLWGTERTGMLYPARLFEDQGHDSGPACTQMLRRIWVDALTVCGIEMHRRVLSLAHNADFESIADTAQRARLEARNLMLGAELILRGAEIPNSASLCEQARAFNGKDFA